MTNAAYITFILVGLLVTAFASGSPEVASSTGKGAKGVSTAAAGSSATAGSFAGGYGYAGSGVSNNALGADSAGGGVGLGEGVAVGGYPQYMPFPQFPQFDFNLLLANYFQALNKYHQGLFSKHGHPKGSFANGVVFNSSPNQPVFFQASAVSSNGAVNQANSNGAGAFSSTGYGFPGGYPAYQTFSSQSGYGAGAAPSAGANTGSSYSSSGLSSSSPGGGFSSYASTNPGFGGFSGYGSSGFGGGAGFGGGSGFGGFGGFPNYAVPNFGGPGFDTINYGANAIPTGDNSAIASASIGQDGIQQSAAISPENPGVPNFNSRFADVPKEGGTFGVFTSSSSGSGNVNGKPVSFKQATTTVNNNGKITTHTVHDP